MPEMILVCNALRNDLTSPNEYIRGCMLRFLCKLKEPELLEPLMPVVKQALEHRHSYVRRNAALAVYSIHKSFGDQLLPDGAELMEKFIMTESDMSARRNAFLMLFNEAEQIAIDYLTDHFEDITKFGDGFALLVLELTRKVSHMQSYPQPLLLTFIFYFLFLRRADAIPRKSLDLFAAYSSCSKALLRLLRTRQHGLWCRYPLLPPLYAILRRPMRCF